MAGIQDTKLGGEIIGGKVRCYEKPSKPQKHIWIKVILRLGQPIYEVRPEPVNPKFSVTPTFS